MVTTDMVVDMDMVMVAVMAMVMVMVMVMDMVDEDMVADHLTTADPTLMVMGSTIK
jgi:hypothetical protein